MAQLCNESRDLMPGQLAALTRLGSLRDLDLNLFRVRQILCRNAEATRGDLLDLVIERAVHGRSRDQFRDGGGASLTARSGCKGTSVTEVRRRRCDYGTIDVRILTTLARIRTGSERVH